MRLVMLPVTSTEVLGEPSAAGLPFVPAALRT
jgi:hypothetical protein